MIAVWNLQAYCHLRRTARSQTLYCNGYNGNCVRCITIRLQCDEFPPRDGMSKHPRAATEWQAFTEKRTNIVRCAAWRVRRTR
jgi:hypothetical protein